MLIFWDGDGSGMSSDDDSPRHRDIAPSPRNSDFLGDELGQNNVGQFWRDRPNESVHKLRVRERARIEEMIRRQKDGGTEEDEDTEYEDAERGSGRIGDIDDDWFGGRHFIVSGSEDGAVCIWDRLTLRMARLEGHRKAVNCVAWNPRDSWLLASGSHDCTIRIWTPSRNRDGRHRAYSQSQR